MADTSSGLVGLLIACSVFFIFAILFFILRRMGKKNLAKKRLLVQRLEKEFGLVNRNPKSMYPNLSGEVNGVKIAIDVYMQSYARSEPGRGERPWLRVRAQLPAQPDIQTQARGQTYSDSPASAPEWLPHEEGYPPFDRKYVLFIREGVAPQKALPPAVREALIAATPPVAVLGKVVSWMKIGANHSPELVANAVRSCSGVAAALIENS